MTSLVTGASGFLGGHVVEELCRRGENVVVFARKTSDLSAVKHLPIEVRYGELRDVDSMKGIMDDVDMVFNCAGSVRFHQAYDKIHDINVVGTERLVAAAADAEVEKVVHTSSIAALGPDGIVDSDSVETNRPDIKSVYSRSKTEAEAAFFKRCAERGIKGSALRPGVIYGPRDMTAAYYWFNLVDAGEGMVVGDGTTRFPLIYVDDVVEAFMTAAEREGAVGRTYNLDGPERASIKRIYDLISNEFGKEPRYRSVSYRSAMFAAKMSEFKAALGGYKNEPRYSTFVIFLFGKDHEKPDCSNAVADLGFQPKIGLDEGIKRTAIWYRTLKADSKT
jgi:nucleoside-diphosphate-sugar epimerase